MLPRDVGSHTTKGSSAPAVAVSVTPAAAPTATAAALPSAAATTTAPLFGLIAALAIDRTIASWFERYGRGLATAGAHHGGSGAHTPAAATAGIAATATGVAAATTCVAAAVVMSMRRSMPAAAGILFSLAARFAAPRRGVATLLEKLLFACGENKLLTAIATGK